MEALHDDIFRPMHRRNHFIVPMAGPMPMLVPADEDDDEHSFYEVMPAPKPNRKLQWADEVRLVEIENVLDVPSDYSSDEDSYEIEILDEEDGEDADFQLEIVDGEVYYVFETEDDVSVEGDDADMEYYESDSEDSRTQQSNEGTPTAALQLNFAGPNVDVVTETVSARMKEDDDLLEGKNYGTQRGSRFDSSIGDLSKEVQDIAIDLDESQDMDMVDLKVPTGNLVFHSSPDLDDSSTISGNEEAPVTPTVLVDIPHESPDNNTSKPSISSMSSAPQSPGILKARLSQATVEQQKKEEAQQKKKKTKKTITKTYVRADAFDGEHSPIAWKKPKWAEEGPKLRSTGNADKMKTGNLASPITSATENAHWKHDLLGDDSERGEIVMGDNGEEVELTGMNANELVQYLASKGASGAALSRFKNKTQRKLKFTLGGAKIREGGDIVKPITKATQYRKKDDMNPVAKPDILKKTEGPARKKYSWTVPEWTKQQLQDTGKREQIKKKGDLAAPITHIRQTKKYEWERPSWAKPRQKAEDEQDTSADDYQSPRQANKPKIGWEKPSWATVNSKGADSLLGEKSDVKISPRRNKPKIGWTKPSWAKHDDASSRRVLKTTEKGMALKKGEEIAKPVTKLPELVKSGMRDTSPSKESPTPSSASTSPPRNSPKSSESPSSRKNSTKSKKSTDLSSSSKRSPRGMDPP